MRRRRLVGLILTVGMAAALWGCGSNLDSGGTQVAAGDGLESAAKLGIDNCANCHNSGTKVTADWLAGPHANPNATPNTTSATCVPCHDPAGDNQKVAAAFAGQSARSVVGCEGCHGGGQFHYGLGEIPFPRPDVARCTECHGIDVAKFHSTSSVRLINDTHFDKPGTADIEGYIVNTDDDRGCLKCHFNAHKLELEINRQWARSAHAGFVLDIKDAAEAAALDAGSSAGDAVIARIDALVTTTDAPAWTEYDFKGADRASCQRCHTSTGAANFLSDPATYASADNAFFATGAQREMLYCWACHVADGSSTLRAPGAITADYTGAPTTYPDVDASNVCLACHIGRESGESIKANTGDFTNIGFINSHYLTAGGNLFGVIGYNYAGRDYTADPIFAHPRLGTDGNLGENGPCVSCHMSAAESHLFLPVTTGPTGLVASVTSPLCANCHAGIDANWLNGVKEEVEAGLMALEVQLAANGMFFASAYPYFFNDTNGNGILDDSEKVRTNGVRNWVDQDTMGAAFNYNMLHHDPGAYAHNPEYAKRLIWDSIDWLDDGVLNNSTPAAVAAQSEDPLTPYKTAALAYLGTTRP